MPQSKEEREEVERMDRAHPGTLAQELLTRPNLLKVMDVVAINAFNQDRQGAVYVPHAVFLERGGRVYTALMDEERRHYLAVSPTFVSYIDAARWMVYHLNTSCALGFSILRRRKE